MASRAKYPWSRWWLPAGVEPSLTSGFLDDPAGPFTSFDSQPIKLADCDEHFCVILFGEAGIGKSEELKDDLKRHQLAGRLAVMLDLGAHDTWMQARDWLLSQHDVRAWQKVPDEQFVMLVDSVDEVTTPMPKLTDNLLRLLDDLPSGQMLLRVAGRSSAFPTRLHDELDDRFQGSCRSLGLAPLTWSDVERAVAVKLGQSSVSGFMAAVAERDIGVLASRPFTLGMLLELYGAGPLPTSRIRLYERAIDCLARETCDRRLDESAADIPIGQRLEMARTLAAVTILGGRASIAVHRYPSTPEGQLSLDQVAETRDEFGRFAAMTQTALFGATSASQVRWAHRDFAEFLTARSLAKMDASQAMALVSDRNDPDKIVPQLIGTAVWAASLNAQLFGRLVSVDPELMLSSALADARPEQRRQLLLALLDRMTHRPLSGWNFYYRWLGYEGLPADVAPYLNADKPARLRREAARILSDTGHHELDGELAAIVESVASEGGPDRYDEHIQFAMSVAACLRDATNPEVLDRLAKVVLDTDAPREIRIAVLSDLWRSKPTSEVLDILGASGVFSGHHRFVRSAGVGLADAFVERKAEPGPVVDWLAANGMPAPAPETADTYAVGEAAREWIGVVETCLLAAINKPDALTEVQWNRLAALYAAVAPDIDDPFRWRRDDVDDAPDDGRRKAAAKILAARPERFVAHLLLQAGLLAHDDRDWMLSQSGEAPDRSNLADAYGFAARIIVEPPLDHDAARPQATKNDFGCDRLQATVDEQDWPAAASELRKPLNGKKWAKGTALATSPGWQALAPAAHVAVVNTAASYLALASAPKPATVSIDDLGDAWTLVAAEDPQRLDAIDPAILSVWLTALISEPFQYLASATVTERLRSSSPARADEVVLAALEEDLARGHPYVIDRIGCYASPAVIDALDRIAKDPAATRFHVLAFVKALLKRDESRGADTALSIMRRRPSAPETRLHWDRAVAAAVALTCSPALDNHLDSLLAEMSDSAEFAADIIRLSERAYPGRPWGALSANRKADLLVWARRNLPEEPYHPPGEVIDVNPVHDFSRRITRMLTSDVSAPAVAALRRAGKELDDPWLLNDAETLAAALRETNWEPLTPQKILQILKNPGKYLNTPGPQPEHVFLSYVSEDRAQAEQLLQSLEGAGFQVWLDVRELLPGDDRKQRIRAAIEDGALAFIVCFSRASQAKAKSDQFEQLLLAIDQFRQRQPGQPWLIPVRFDDCPIPDFDLGASRSLRSLQPADLFGDEQADHKHRLIKAIQQIRDRETGAWGTDD